MNRRTFSVSGMSCSGCERSVENTLGNLAGVNRAEADHEAGTVELVASDDVTEEDVHAAIGDAGYDVET